MQRFHSRDQQLYKLIETKENFYIRKEFNSHRIRFEHSNMVAVSSFWNTIMAVVSSCKNAGGLKG